MCFGNDLYLTPTVNRKPGNAVSSSVCAAYVSTAVALLRVIALLGFGLVLLLMLIL